MHPPGTVATVTTVRFAHTARTLTLGRHQRSHSSRHLRPPTAVKREAADGPFPRFAHRSVAPGLWTTEGTRPEVSYAAHP